MNNSHANRLDEIVIVIQHSRRAQGYDHFDDGKAFSMARAWDEGGLNVIPNGLFWEVYLHARKTRTNAGSLLNDQNLLVAFHDLARSGRVKLERADEERDPRCPDCHGTGWMLLDRRGEVVSVEDEIQARRAGLADWGGVAACRCSAPNGRHGEMIGQMMRILADLCGEIEDPDREAEAVERMLTLGWTRSEIVTCRDDLEAEGFPAPQWSDVAKRIGPRYFKRELAALAPPRTAVASVALGVVSRPVSEAAERRDAAQRKAAAEAARGRQENDEAEG